ncbi:glycosyltransferase family 4 protein [Asticcacaulis benevestitus]|uniref:Glycosyltransferase subfamily 4-like N-terminal domain-containing protein n=1 Tax=Asticcacaulis benevestitus DSM 16100 = ATCC BAA-896 TaxID=1121022 RepID=V4PME2_9CAUL|nr:glycosyltransferase family 4 protein [Asticcacaulis benevestitus]ESQ89431.1 hypothetical protein ABENE_13715 [Asticcacaulis benevestitus DSM 16100 = ATCC BAA-896]
MQSIHHNFQEADLADAKVLYLTKLMPYGRAMAGDAVYSRGIIEALSTLARVEVLCASSTEGLNAFGKAKWHIGGSVRKGRAGSVFSSLPNVAWKGRTNGYHKNLDALLRQDWDIIVLDNLGSVHCLPKCLKYKLIHPDVRLVYISHEYEYLTRRQKYKSYKLSPLVTFAAKIDELKVKRAELQLLKSVDLVTVINEGDKATFESLSPHVPYYLFPPGYSERVVEARCIDSTTPRQVLLFGGRESEQKRQILRDWLEIACAPLRQMGISIVVAGAMDSALREHIERAHPEVIVRGYVSDIEALMAECRIGIIADTVGGGFKLRLLSYVFHRLPIMGVTGAVSGLPTPAGLGYLEASNLVSLTDLIIEHIDNSDYLNGMQKKAFDDCLGKFDAISAANGLLKRLL